MKIGLLYLALAVGTINCSVSYADDIDNLSAKVLQWVKEGKVIPFEKLMKRYRSRLKGRLLDLEIEYEDGVIIYELELIRDNSIVYEVKINAKTGEWLSEEVED